MRASVSASWCSRSSRMVTGGAMFLAWSRSTGPSLLTVQKIRSALPWLSSRITFMPCSINWSSTPRSRVLQTCTYTPFSLSSARASGDTLPQIFWRSRASRSLAASCSSRSMSASSPRQNSIRSAGTEVGSCSSSPSAAIRLTWSSMRSSARREALVRSGGRRRWISITPMSCSRRKASVWLSAAPNTCTCFMRTIATIPPVSAGFPTAPAAAARWRPPCRFLRPGRAPGGTAVHTGAAGAPARCR